MMHLLATLALLASPPNGGWVTTHAWEDGSGPIPREHASIFVHEDDLVVFAGSGYKPQLSPLSDAWRFDTQDNEWIEMRVEGELPDSAGSMRSASLGQDQYLLLGGYGEGFACSNTLSIATIEEDRIVIDRVEQRDPPPARALHAFAVDPESGMLIAFGGVSQQGLPEGTFVAHLDDGVYVWERLALDEEPSPRFGMSYGFDTDTGTLIIASGQDSATSMQMSTQVWTLNIREQPPRWTLQTRVPESNAVRNPCFAWDQPRHTLWVWCGTPDGRANAPDMIGIHHGKETTVTRIQRDNEPQQRSSGSGAVLSDGTVWMGFGNHAKGVMRDWVVFDPDLPATSAEP